MFTKKQKISDKFRRMIRNLVPDFDKLIVEKWGSKATADTRYYLLSELSVIENLKYDNWY